jgi:N-acetylmuramoyl-L-alanine amidase
LITAFRRRGLAAVAAVSVALAGYSSQAAGQTLDPIKPIHAALGLSGKTSIGQPVASPLPTPAPVPQVRGEIAQPKKSLNMLVREFWSGPDLDAQAKCIATAVYFESMGEPLEGQLAVARVVINRAASGRYPDSMCGVVKQKAQFSFVRGGVFPRIDTSSQAWGNAKAITRIALQNAAESLSKDVLWYHADYVAPSWGRRLQRAEKIGAHIFYRS